MNNKTFEIKLRDAFLSLSKTNREHVKILNGVDAGSFQPASINDFSKLQEITKELPLMENQ
jgi:ABC-type phosphate/phosphonate transport system substrate-binding protein